MVTSFVIRDGDKERNVPRVAPLLAALASPADPDGGRTTQVQAALKAATGSDAARASIHIAAGMKKNVGPRGMDELAGIRSLTCPSEQAVASRGIERHDSKIDKVLLYKVVNPGGHGYLMVFLDAAGLVGDYDLVVN